MGDPSWANFAGAGLLAAGRNPPARTVYRCDRCGLLAYPPTDEPYPVTLDDEKPRIDCGCFMGPRWVRFVLVPAPSTEGANDE